jgi:hypothetical protein
MAEGVGVSRWQLVTRGLTDVLQNSAPPEISWGLKAFPGTEAQQCVGVSSAVEVPVAAANANVIAAVLARRSPTGKNTPTGEAVKAADQYLAQQSGAGPTFILLVTDGEPNCPANPPGVPYAVQTIGEARARGFRTFVVGISATTDPINASLNQMAIAGGASTTSSNARAAAMLGRESTALLQRSATATRLLITGGRVAADAKIAHRRSLGLLCFAAGLHARIHGSGWLG